MPTPETLALIYAAGGLAVIGFQIALIAGAPWGRITQGGQHAGALPASGRIIALVSIAIVAGQAAAIASAAGLWPHWPLWTSFVACAIQALSTVLNWITPSPPERRLWGPIMVGMLALAGSVLVLS